MRFLCRHRWMAMVGALLAAAAAWGLSALWRAQITLKKAAIEVRGSSELPFSFESAPNYASARFEVVSAPADFRTAAPFDGDLFVGGKSGLFRYSSDGTLKQSWLAGRELPAAELTALAVRRGIGSPELWIATNGAGALAFDGHSFRQLLPAEAGYRKITALLALSGGRMLLGTAEHGLLVTDAVTLRQFHPLFAKTQVTALGGNEDELWIGTRGAGAYLWKAGRSQQFLTELADPQVLSIATAPGRAWLGTALGISEIREDGPAGDSHFARGLAQGTFAQALALDESSHRLVIGTLNEGVFQVPLDAAVPRPRPRSGEQRSANEPPVESLLATADGVAAVTPQALALVGTRKTLVASSGAQLADGHIAALLADGAGRLWVGYFDRGLDLISPRDALPRHWEDDRLFCVNRIRESATGAVAVATANGLALFDAGGRLAQVLDRKSGLIASHVTDVLFRRDDSGEPSMVVATPAGVSFVEGGSVTSIYAFHGLVNNHVYTLAEREDGILAGTLGGFSLLKNGMVTASFTTANSGLKQNWITASASEGGTTYLGTYGAGVIQLRADGALEAYETVERRNERVEINPNALLATRRAVYAGTAGLGLAVLPRGAGRWHYVRQGLPSLNVTALASRDGILYAGTDNGLRRIREEEIP
jgi:ligand-binding sensor domain-containing protein